MKNIFIVAIILISCKPKEEKIPVYPSGVIVYGDSTDGFSRPGTDTLFNYAGKPVAIATNHGTQWFQFNVVPKMEEKKFHTPPPKSFKPLSRTTDGFGVEDDHHFVWPVEKLFKNLDVEDIDTTYVTLVQPFYPLPTFDTILIEWSAKRIWWNKTVYTHKDSTSAWYETGMGNQKCTGCDTILINDNQ